MSLIMLCLLPLITLSFLCVILGSDFISISISTAYRRFGSAMFAEMNITASDVQGLESDFGIDMIIGALSIIITLGVLAGLIGIRILGSGLADPSIKIMVLILVYTGLWTILSFLAYPLIKEIEFFGVFIYVGLSLGYVIGVIQKIAEG